MSQIHLEDRRCENLTDFSEDVAPVSDVCLTQNVFGVVLISPV